MPSDSVRFMPQNDDAIVQGLPWGYLRGLRSPWQASRRSVLVAITLSALISILVASIQDFVLSWHEVGHSLVLWIALALTVSTRGTIRQAAVNTTVLLVVSIALYYLTQLLVSPYERSNTLGLILFWMVIAIAGGSVFAILSLLAFKHSDVGGIATGFMIGVVVGDVANTSGGILFYDSSDLIEILGATIRLSPLTIIGGIALLAYSSAMMIHHRKMLRSLRFAPAGVVLGYVGVSIPDLILH